MLKPVVDTKRSLAIILQDFFTVSNIWLGIESWIDKEKEYLFLVLFLFFIFFGQVSKLKYEEPLAPILSLPHRMLPEFLVSVDALPLCCYIIGKRKRLNPRKTQRSIWTSTQPWLRVFQMLYSNSLSSDLENEKHTWKGYSHFRTAHAHIQQTGSAGANGKYSLWA